MRGSQPWKTNRARVLRASDSSAEDLLWQELRGRRLGGLKFVRQVPIGHYFGDFVCREHKLVVEVDGGTHCSAVAVQSDNLRADFLRAAGYRIVRVGNTEIYENLDGVLESLLAFMRGDVP